MAKKPKAPSQTLARLTPHALNVVVDGQELRVPMNREENTLMNVVLASQVRTFIQDMVQKYKASDKMLTPAELRDLAKAFAEIANSSGDLYIHAEDLTGDKAKREPADNNDFSFDVTPKNEPATDSDPSSGTVPIDSSSEEGPPEAA